MSEELKRAAKSMLPFDFKIEQYEDIVLSEKETRDTLHAEIRRQARMQFVTEQEVTLTSEQMNEALRRARMIKKGIENERAYWKKVSEPRVYPQMTAKEMLSYVLHNADGQLEKVRGGGNKFELGQWNRDIVWKLCQYFTDDPEFEKGDYSLRKGIMLVGPVGCGKTMLMKLFRSNQKASFQIVGCQTIGYEFAKEGFDVILRHAMISRIAENLHGQTEMGTCYDDLGADEQRKYYGDRTNALNEILESRYRLDRHYLTHLTTNLDGPGIEEFYGLRARSRCREMFNVILFNSQSPDMRK